ncbi:MAG: ribonuclease E/G, partial [Paracoccaceae bacterium]
PELLVDGPLAHEVAWRDWADPEPDAVEQTATAMEDHGVLDTIDVLLTPVVPLGAGGSMVVEPTRALVAVDINTGPDTSPAASLKVNIAAARDLPRQLRLRGLGGQVVVDFAPMPKRDRAILEQVLRAAFKGEAAETSLAGWTPLGLYELARKRDRQPLHEVVRA